MSILLLQEKNDCYLAGISGFGTISRSKQPPATMWTLLLVPLY